MTLGQTLNSINVTKKNILKELSTPDDLVCPPYIMNRHFTAFIETVFIAELFSMCRDMSPEDNYIGYLGLVPQGRRYNKIIYKNPPPASEDVLDICRAYNISVEKYNEIKHLLGNDV